MTQSNHLTNLNDQEIEKLCQGESAKRSSNPRPSYCFELFRRAIEDKSQAAWDAIHKQYQAMIRGWINADNVDQDDLFQKSFTKFLEAFEKENDLSKFKTIGSILGFWRKTTKNIVIDHLRAIERERRGIDEIAKIFPIHQTGFDEVQLDMQTFIRRIKDQLKDEEERIAFELRFEFDLKPAAIAQKYPHLFASAKAVSTVVERIKLRLKRDPMISQLLDGLAF